MHRQALELGPIPGLKLGDLLTDAPEPDAAKPMDTAAAKEIALGEGFALSWRRIAPLLRWGVVTELDEATAELRLDPGGVAVALAARREFESVDPDLLELEFGSDAVSIRSLPSQAAAAPIVEFQPELMLPAESSSEYGALGLPPARAAAWRRLRMAMHVAQAPRPDATGRLLSLWPGGAHLTAEDLRACVDPT
jgi:hypothetical protein